MKYLPLAARVCLCLIFHLAGISQILGFNNTALVMTNNGLPIACVLLLFTVVFQLWGGLSLL